MTMPVGRTKGVYSAVTGVVVFLAVAFTFGAIIRPYIPAPEPNARIFGRGTYLNQASRQPVEWRPATAASFGEARRLDMPIFLVMGRSYSQTADQFDEVLFTDPEASEGINRAFIPIRVDLDENPGWESFFLPVTQANLRSQPGLQIAILTSEAKLVGWIAKLKPEDKFDIVWLAETLQKTKDSMRKKDTATQIKQEMETNSIFSGFKSVPPPNLDSYCQTLIDLENRQKDRLEIRPWVIELLADSGRLTEADQILTRWLSTRLVDWVNGGIFTAADTPKGDRVEFSKSAEINAEMAALCARMYLRTRKEFYREFTLWLAKSFETEFVMDGYVASGVYDPRDADNRSDRHSFPPAILNKYLTQAERVKAKNALGLDLSKNPTMAVYSERPEDLMSDMDSLRPILDKLHTAVEDKKPRRPSEGYCSVTATASARFLEAGLLLDEKSITRLGELLFGMTQKFFKGESGIEHDTLFNGDQSYYASDLTGAAEACYYMAALKQDKGLAEKGASFAHKAAGLLSVWEKNRSNLPGDAAWSLLWFDTDRKSDIARIVEVANLYQAVGGNIRFESKLISPWFAKLATETGKGGASIVGPTLNALDGRAVVEAGPLALQRWRDDMSHSPAINSYLNPGYTKFKSRTQLKDGKVVPEVQPAL